jgi:hypothetical protein
MNRQAVWQIVTDISEEYAPSIFRVQDKDGDSTFLQNFGNGLQD